MNQSTMNEDVNQPFPVAYADINNATKLAGFTMSSDLRTCSLLRTLAASKPCSKFLELGTGTGLSASWILDGMDNESTLTSIENDPLVYNIALSHLNHDPRLNLVLIDGSRWIEENRDLKFDYIFADTWHGKYLLLNEVLTMLNRGGFYIIDDMLPQTNWPDGHMEKVIKLIADLESREDVLLTEQIWASGIIVAVKK
jgi:predicted O-methyltransferase YrrM